MGKTVRKIKTFIDHEDDSMFDDGFENRFTSGSSHKRRRNRVMSSRQLRQFSYLADNDEMEIDFNID